MDKETIGKAFLTRARADDRISPWHISLYLALVACWEVGDWRNPASITRREVMALAHIRSLATYHKCMRELVALGYIQYLPSYNPFLGSLVYFNRMECRVESDG